MDMTLTGAPAAAGHPASDRARAAVRAWLLAVAGLIVAMIVVGGATRLTNSGLSITEWKPIHGAIPPLSAAEWEEEFARYREIPQYRLLNDGMTLAEFQAIFWWEWAHRLLGRVIGLAFALPLAWFWLTGALTARLKPRLVVLFLLGGLQGAVGWWMVASGLVDRVDVSPYRLAVHLTLACLLLCAIVRVAEGLRPVRPGEAAAPAFARRDARFLLGLVFLQIVLGALVAGLDAGFAYNTWPLMDGVLVPDDLYTGTPWWRPLFEEVRTVQFDHRVVAYLLTLSALVAMMRARRRAPGTTAARGATLLAALVIAQAAIGIATLVLVVPLGLGLLHQFGAAVVLIAATRHLARLSPPDP